MLDNILLYVEGGMMVIVLCVIAWREIGGPFINALKGEPPYIINDEGCMW
ncbi:MAG: hypothetical protein M1324_02420 [Patescibacteria group bacterium]|nr:hypothetical protein [Patescibacteria group bacterium]